VTIAVITLIGMVITLTIIVMTFWVAWNLGEEFAIEWLQNEAVALGHAEFVADNEGNVEFKWKENCK
jgi:hypothetical protein